MMNKNFSNCFFFNYLFIYEKGDLGTWYGKLSFHMILKTLILKNDLLIWKDHT